MFVPHRCDDDENCCESDEGEVEMLYRVGSSWVCTVSQSLLLL